MSTDHATTDQHGDAGHDAHADGHDAHGHGDHGGGLGPVDLRMWGAGLVGVALGLVGAITFAIATGRFS